MNFANSSSTMCLANPILLGQVGSTCCAATYFIRSMTPTLATLLGKAITPQMVALGAAAMMSATPPIPIFSGSVVTSIKGAAIHHDGGWMMWMCHAMFFVSVRLDRQTSSQKRCTCARVPALVMIDMAPERTWRKGQHDRWRQPEHDKKENWRWAAGALRSFVLSCACVCRLAPVSWSQNLTPRIKADGSGVVSLHPSWKHKPKT